MRLQHLCLWIFRCGLGGLSLAACQQGGAFDPLETATTQDLGQGKGQDLLPAVVDCKDAAAATATRCRVGDLTFIQGTCNITEPAGAKWQDNTSVPGQIQLGESSGSFVSDMSCKNVYVSRACEVQLKNSLRVGTAKSAHLKFTQDHFFNSNPTDGSYGLTRGLVTINDMRVYETAANLPYPYSVDLPIQDNLLTGAPLVLKFSNEYKCLNYTSSLGMYWKISDMTLEIER